jgi:hypothetical protein
MLPDANERRPTMNQLTDRDDDGNNLDVVPQGLFNADNRLQYPDSQQPKVQFSINNNFFKNVTENKDISKLISQLATCINGTKKVCKLNILFGLGNMNFAVGFQQHIFSLNVVYTITGMINTHTQH